MKKFWTAIVLLIVSSLAVALALGCGGSTAKTPASSTTTTQQTSGAKAEPVKVADVSRNPTAYDGKVVVTEGNYAVGYCSACFLLKDGVAAVRCEVSDTAPLPPESKLGARMRVTGKVYIIKDTPNIISEKIEYL